MGTEKLDSISCAHVEAEEGYREVCSYPVPTLRRKNGYREACPCHLCPRCDGRRAQRSLLCLSSEEGHREACSCHLCPYCGGRRVQRSLPLSPVPTLRRKNGHRAEFVLSTAPLRYEPCTQFINVSQRALHIYFIEGCRVCPLTHSIKSKNKNSDL